MGGQSSGAALPFKSVPGGQVLEVHGERAIAQVDVKATRVEFTPVVSMKLLGNSLNPQAIDQSITAWRPEFG